MKLSPNLQIFPPIFGPNSANNVDRPFLPDRMLQYTVRTALLQKAVCSLNFYIAILWSDHRAPSAMVR
jgi:hypothetical protein